MLYSCNEFNNFCQPLELREDVGKVKATVLGWWTEGDGATLLNLASGLEYGRCVKLIK